MKCENSGTTKLWEPAMLALQSKYLDNDHHAVLGFILIRYKSEDFHFTTLFVLGSTSLSVEYVKGRLY